MTDDAMVAQSEAARAYEALFVPSLFRQWPPSLLDKAGVTAGDRVLDVACGTGVLAREAVSRVAPSGTVVGLDVMPGMLEVARELAPHIAWRQGSADRLPFEDGSFEAVFCQFGLMFFPDKPAALREMHRVLVPGGRLVVAVFDRLERIPAYAREAALLERLAGRAASQALQAPFVLGDEAELARLVRGAGFAAVEVSTLPGLADFPGIGSLLEADLRGWLPVMDVNLDESTIQQVLEEAQQELADFVDERGRAVFAVSAHLVSGLRE